MHVFLIYVRDKDYFQMLPQELGGSRPGDKRVKVMAFPPSGSKPLPPCCSGKVTRCGCSTLVILK